MKITLRAALLVAIMLVGPGGCASTPAPAPAPVLTYEDYVDASRELMRFDHGGTIRNVRWADDGRTLSFSRLETPYEFDLGERTLTESVAAEDGDERGRGGRRRGPGRGRQREREPSPDGRWVAVSKDWNVVIEGVDTDEVITVTSEGTRKRRFGKASWVYGEELAQQSAMWWSPDSRYLVYYEFDEREVQDFYLLSGLTELRTGPMLEGYPKPGEPNPVASLRVYDVETGLTTSIETSGGAAGSGAEDEEWYLYNIRFVPDGSTLLLSRTNRHQNVLHVEAADVRSGRSRTILTETQSTWQSNRPAMRFLADGNRFIWETEKRGVRQFELRDLDGRLLATLTPDRTPAIAVSRVDEDAGRVYYTTHGDDHPLNVYLHRVNLDGTGDERLTPEPGRHTVTFSPDGRWLIDRHETISRAPTTVLRDADGHQVAVLAEADAGRIEALGYPDPELFTFKADDGETDLYGWLYKPRGFDPSRVYPLLVDVYGGPESKGVRHTYRPAHPDVVNGFLVAKIDNRGTGGRGKAFLGAVYQRLGDIDLKDQADGVRHLLQRPYVDAQRIGIAGHSYGGYMAALAMLKYPDLFQVAVAGAPVTDWRNYDTIYTERYMRTPEENPEGYDEGSCIEHAGNLRGHLLLLHGMVDDNVHPNNVWQLVDALQSAGKSFDVMFYPKNGHGLARHSRRVRWEFLRRHLAREGPAADAV